MQLDQIKSESRYSAITLRHFHIKKLSKWHIKMTRYQTSRPKMPGSTSLRRLKLVDFIYAPVRRHKDVSNRSDKFIYQLIYHLRRHGDISVWSWAFRLATKMSQFLLGTISVNFLGVSSGLFKAPASTLLQCLKDVCLI